MARLLDMDEFNLLFHATNTNRVAFKRVTDTFPELLNLVNVALETRGSSDEDMYTLLKRREDQARGEK